MFLDAGGHPVSAEGGSNKVIVYVGSAAYKVTAKTSSATTVWTLDNIKGALDTSSFAVTSAAPSRPIVSRSDSSWSVSSAAAAAGTIYKSNPTSGSQTVTLPSAVTAGDGYTFTIVHDGGSSTNTVRVQTVSSQTVDFGGVLRTSFGLMRDGETVTIISDGANWTATEYKAGLIPDRVPFFTVADRLTAPPTSPTAGARYIINGTPTGDWASYAQHDVVEATGAGTWTKWTPPADAAWFAYVEDENLYTAFVGSAWVDQSGMAAPQSSTLKRIVVADVKSQGTAGGTPSTSAWTAHTLNTTDENDITGASLATNQVTLPAGSYMVFGSVSLNRTGISQVRFKSTTTTKAVTSAQLSLPGTDAVAAVVSFSGIIELSEQELFELQYYVANSAGSDGLGIARNVSGESERYASVVVLDVTSLQGATGAQGPQGAAGADGADAGFSYTWDTNTSSSDPGTGELKANNATLADITEIYISETDGDAQSLAAEIATWDDNTSATRGKVKIQGSSGSILFGITGANTDNGSWVTLAGSVLASYGTLSGTVSVLYVPTGDKGTTGDTGATGAAGSTGATGATGPNVGLDYQWSTGTSGDPGSGKLLVDNATPASATALHISETNRQSASQAAYLATWDDSTTTAARGVIRILDVSAPGTNFLEYQITGSLADAGSYDTFPVSYIGGAGTIANDAIVSVMFFRTGNQGASGAGTGDVVGPASSVDGEIALFDSTTGKLIKRASTTGILKATSGVVAQAVAGTDVVVPGGALGTPSSGTLTNATGLPIASGVSGLGTGVATALAVNVGSAGAPVINGGALGTPSSGTLTNATGLPVAGITASTSTPLGVGSIELGHASDTTLARSTAGEVTIEGVAVKKAGKETIWIPAGAMTARTTNGAAAGTTELTTNDVMLSTLDFDTTTEEGAGFWIAMPKSWNEGTVGFQALWTAASGSGGVAFGLACYSFSDDDAMDTAVSGQQIVTDTLLTANDLHISSESSAITIGGTPAEGDAVYFEVTREVADGSDTIAADVKLLGIRLFFTTNASTDA